MLWRQGDVFVERIPTIPTNAAPRADAVLVEGEATGHQHRLLDPLAANVYGFRQDLYLEVVADFAQLVHDEHATLWLDRGNYRVWRQREYEPERFGQDGSRIVWD